MRRLVNTLQARECRHRRRDGASERAPSSKNLRFAAEKGGHAPPCKLVFIYKDHMIDMSKAPDAMHPTLFYKIEIPIFWGKLHHIVFRKVVQPHTAKRHAVRRAAVYRQMVVQGENPAFIVRMNFGGRPVTGHKHFILKINPLIVR